MRIILIAIIAAILGVTLLIWASTLEPYKDMKAFNAARVDSPTEGEDSHVASEKYWHAREALLTPKFQLQDYGCTLIALSLFLIAAIPLLKIHRLADLASIETPKSIWIPVLIGYIAVILTTIAHIKSLFLDMTRDEFPIWADSLGIPLSGVPVIFVFLFFFVAFVSGLGGIKYMGGFRILDAFKKEFHPRIIWIAAFGIPTLICFLMTINSIIFGDFLFLVPNIFWLSYFLFLLAGKQKRPFDDVAPEQLAPSGDT